MKRSRKHRQISVSHVIADLSPAPFGEKESETVRWLQIERSEVTPSPYPDLRLRFELCDGSWICTGLHLETEGKLTAQELAERLPFKALEGFARQLLALANEAQPPRITAPRRRGRKGHSDEFLRQVAAHYRYALESPEHQRAPVRYLKGRRELWTQGHEPHEDTVRYWIRQARKRGLLGPSMPGKAGELPLESGEGDA